VADLPALHELRISTGAAIQNFGLHPEGLPSSLRRLSVTNDIKAPHLTHKFLAIAPPSVPLAPPAAVDTAEGPVRLRTTWQAASTETTALPELLSLVLTCPKVVLRASLPLAASCAVTIDTANLLVMRSRELSLRVGTDRKRVTSVLLLCHSLPRSSSVVMLGVAWLRVEIQHA